MAYEIPGFSFTLVAGVDLSASQFCAVDVNSSGQARLPTGAGARVLGVVQNKPKATETATIVVSGITKMVVGAGGLTAGQDVMTDATGKAVLATSTNRVIGIALKTVAAGGYVTVALGSNSGAII